MRYLPALDGVRAFAVIAVLLAHSTPHADGGVLGVDVFFVLSGFLITSLLIAEHEQHGRIMFSRFYMRRAWRLMPPLFACFLLVALLPDVYLIPAADGESSPRWQTILLAGTYLSNFAPALHVDMGYLGHTWSLAVEEQFYLLWPITLLVLIRRGVAVKVIAVLIAAAIVARPALDAGWLPSRGDGLLWGALLAVLANQRRSPAFLEAFWVGALGVLLIVADAGFLSVVHGEPPGSYAAITMAGIASVLIIGHVTKATTSPLTRLLSARPLVELGKLSYTVYLLHFPIFQWVAHQRYGLPMTYLLDIVLLIPAVAACWFLVERPARKQKAKWSTVEATDAVAAESPEDGDANHRRLIRSVPKTSGSGT